MTCINGLLNQGGCVFVIFGYSIVIVSVLGGYSLVGGNIGILLQPSELIIICGSALGAFIIGNKKSVVTRVFYSFPLLFNKTKYTKNMYLDLLSMLFIILTKNRQQGGIAIENDIEDPSSSPIFQGYVSFTNDNIIMAFIIDYLRVIISGNLHPYEIQQLMDEEIETSEQEKNSAVGALHAMGDGLPAFGIIAAVMGVINALAGLDGSMEEVGVAIASAMVGTFLGILFAYGFILPLSSLLRQKNAEQIKVLQCIRTTLLASLQGYSPQLAVEFGRKTVFSDVRPDFAELEEYTRQAKTQLVQNISDVTP